MRRMLCRLTVLVIVVFITAISGFAQSRFGNSISGFVFDAASRSPVAEVHVELLSDVYFTLKRVKTDGTGRFFFNGLPRGTYKVKVLPYGTNYSEQIQDVTFTNNTVGSVNTSENIYLDFYLKADKRKTGTSEFYPAGSIFVQDVPPAALELYKKGITQLESDKEEALGLENLKKALKDFPDYFDALSRLGIEYVRRNQFYESLPYLIKAIQVNPRSFASFYALGIAAYNLKQMKEAEEAFKTTTLLNPQSAYAHLQYGRVLRIGGSYQEAERVLLKAKTLDKESQLSEIYWQLGLLYDKTQRYNNAADELEKYLKIQTDASNVQQIKQLIVKLRAKAKT